MSKYKVGGVAALFSQPKESTSESGKKLQSLFQEFHKKKYRNYARSSQRNTEEIENNGEQGNGKIESQGTPTKEKKRKFSAISAESNVEDYSSKKFKNTKKQGETKSTKYNDKHFLAEQNFPRKKKLSKAKSGNLNDDNFDALNTNGTGFAGNKQVSETIFKSNEKKHASSFIKKSKQQRLAATIGNIEKKDNEKISNIEAETNDTLFKDEREKFTKKEKKTKKKRFCDDNLIQNAETDQNLFDGFQDSKKYSETLDEESPGSDTSLKREVKDFIRSATKKSFGGNHKQNSQLKLDAGEADFIKVPGLKQGSDTIFKDKKQASSFIKKSKQQKIAATNGNIKKKNNEKISNIEGETNGTLIKDKSEEFKKRKDKRNKKKIYDDNLMQNAEFKHTDQNLFDESQDSKIYTEIPDEESPSLKRKAKDFIRSAKKKSFGGNHQQNSQSKLDAEGKPDFKAPSLNPKDLEDKLRRTLYVGNLPLNTKIRALKTLFSPFGQIEQIRWHGIETDKAKIFSEDGPKVLNPNNFAADSIPGFIVFLERQSAVNALSLSGSLFKGNHITVNFALLAGSKKLYDDNRSIFIGNLPFDCKDESVWDVFSECGRIECVRIVRDKNTGISKGFGYVQFFTVQAKESALALEDVNIQERLIRIKAIESNKLKQKNSNNSSLPAKKRDTFKSRAINIKKKNKDSGSRKSVRKIMKKQKRLHNKKKVANILQKSMKL